MRLDLLIALMVVQILLSIGIWVDGYRSRDQGPAETSTQQLGALPGDYVEPEGSSPPTRQLSAPTEVRLPEPTPMPPAPPRIKVQILNGCGKTGIARKAREWLARNDYDIRDVGNADRQDYRNSEVLNRSGNAASARDLARMLGIDESRVKRKAGAPGLDVDLTLVIGNDYRRLPFAR